MDFAIAINATKTRKTRFQDWHDRREYLQSLALDAPHVLLQIKLLDFLISRYRDSAAAHQPVRVGFQRELHWNDRLITVHHHLGRGKVAGAENREDAERRIANLLQRMVSDEPREDEGFELTNFPGAPSLPRVYHNADWQIKLGWNADGHIRATLATSPILSETCLQHLSSRLTDLSWEDRTALNLFLRSKNRNILDWTVRVWRERVKQGRLKGRITETLEDRLLDPDSQPRAAELIRERLADENARVRIAAARIIAQIGDLDDIALLSDLLALPPASDEDPSERDALVTAMSDIAQRLE